MKNIEKYLKQIFLFTDKNNFLKYLYFFYRFYNKKNSVNWIGSDLVFISTEIRD